MRRTLKYSISQGKNHVVIRVSGPSRNNEALMAKKVLSPHLQAKGINIATIGKTIVKQYLKTLLSRTCLTANRCNR